MNDSALYSAASGMTAQQLNVDNIANNLANANTAGYKMRRAQFQDLLYQNMVQPGAAAGRSHRADWTAARPGNAHRVERDRLHAGQLLPDQQSAGRGDPGQRLLPDPAPTGDLAYTRDGIFNLNKDGNMVTSDGDLLNPQITIPPDAQSITIATDGTVSYTLPGQTAAQKAGQIQLAGFPNPAGLNSLGQNLYQPTDASGDAVVGNPGGQEGLGTLLQGYTEQSNVSVVEEFINLIVSQRAYEANSKVVKAADEMYQQMNNVTAMMFTNDHGTSPVIGRRSWWPLKWSPADGCLPIQDDRIYARDVAAAVPAFSGVPADFVLGYAPAPGMRRVFKGDALERLARNQGVTVEALPDVCFERAMATLEAGEVLKAMHESPGTVPMFAWSFDLLVRRSPRKGSRVPARRTATARRGRSAGGSGLARIRALRKQSPLQHLGARPHHHHHHTRDRRGRSSVGDPVREDQVRLESFDTFALDDRPARQPG